MEKELSPLNFALVLVIPTFTFFLVYSGVLFTFYFESVEEEKNMVRVSKTLTSPYYSNPGNMSIVDIYIVCLHFAFCGVFLDRKQHRI